MYNKVILCGRIANDLVLNKTETGKAYARFSLAVNNVFNKKTDFIPIVLWNANAENTVNFSKKGHKVLIEGRIGVRVVERPEGRKTYFDVTGSRITFLETKGSDSSYSLERTDTYSKNQNSFNDISVENAEKTQETSPDLDFPKKEPQEEKQEYETTDPKSSEVSSNSDEKKEPTKDDSDDGIFW